PVNISLLICLPSYLAFDRYILLAYCVPFRVRFRRMVITETICLVSLLLSTAGRCALILLQQAPWPLLWPPMRLMPTPTDRLRWWFHLPLVAVPTTSRACLVIVWAKSLVKASSSTTAEAPRAPSEQRRWPMPRRTGIVCSLL